jgi:hypothetical protein
MTVTVRRSAVKMWLLAIGGIPLLVIAVDVLTNRRITNWLREIIFNPNETQIFEPRDVIWAWALLLFSGFLVLWGLKELFAPTRVIETSDQGVMIRLRGPLRGPDLIPWSNIVDLRAGEIDDEGDILLLPDIEVLTRGDLPAHPWGARWVRSRVLGVLAEDWSQPPARVAESLSQFAVEAARRQARERTASIWKPS